MGLMYRLYTGENIDYEAMFHDVPPSSRILEGHRTLTPSGPRPLTDEFQAILAKSDNKNSDSETECEIRIDEDPPVCNEDVEPNRTEEQEQVRIEREVTPPTNEYVPYPPPSPETTTYVPITIALLPIVSSQPPTTIPVSIPIFTDSTIPPQPSSSPECSVNVSDTGANTSGFSTHVSQPISPIHTDDPEMLFGDDDDEDLEAFSFSPFQIRVDNDDDLFLASNASTSKAYSKAAVESILERVTKEHNGNSSSFSKAVSDSTVVCKEMTEKFDKLITDTSLFMDEYQVTYNNNTSTTIKAIQNVGAMFNAEKASFAELRTKFKSDHKAFQASIDAKLLKLQADLAIESKIMDALALKEKKCKVLETKLHYTQQKVDDLLAEKEVTRSCIYDINRLVSDIIETRDPMISITVGKHLLEKLRPVFAIFSPFGGCFHADVVFETKGEGRSKVYTKDVKPKVSVKPPIIKQDPKDKDSLFSNEPIIDDSEDDEPDEAELKRRKA
uniref:Uncharacterized protein n=1 Tax=Lactuca sativa TaxID=4236 RepID=A0A9R1VS36_LACSA|nr:hypothetical protein LSAT_V11C400209070 [Lactuca sativa]